MPCFTRPGYVALAPPLNSSSKSHGTQPVPATFIFYTANSHLNSMDEIDFLSPSKAAFKGNAIIANAPFTEIQQNRVEDSTNLRRSSRARFPPKVIPVPESLRRKRPLSPSRAANLDPRHLAPKKQKIEVGAAKKPTKEEKKAVRVLSGFCCIRVLIV